jgi:uncharacterized membrane-anchored protein YjiN (DUF445 family)
VLESLDPERLGAQVKAGLARQIERIEIAPLLGQMLTAAIADKRHLPVLEGLLHWLGGAIEENEPLIRAMIHERANAILRFTGLDEKLANGLLDGTYRLLAEVMVDPAHPLRVKVETGLEKLAHELVHDSHMQAKVERMKSEILANPAVGEWWQGVWERIRCALIDLARNPNAELLGGQFGSALAEIGDAVRRDPRLQFQINSFARRTAVGIASRYGDQIVRLVSETVKRWDASTVTGRIEGAVGRDLQFIRINGTLVGGLVGLAIHAVERLL